MLSPLFLSEPIGLDPVVLYIIAGMGVLLLGLMGLVWWTGLRLVRRPAGWQVAVGRLLVVVALMGTGGVIWLAAALSKIPVKWWLSWLVALGTPGYWLLARRLSRQESLTARQQVLHSVWLELAVAGTLLAVLGALGGLTG